MPIILNLETATDLCSVCISDENDVLAIHEADKPHDHARSITLLIENCLADIDLSMNQIDAVAVSSGPGSYTSLRVGASTAKGICYALNLPLISVDTLESIALATILEVGKNALYCPMIDARRMEVYCSIFDFFGKVVKPSESIVIDGHSFEEFFNKNQVVFFSGNGSQKCKNTIHSPLAFFSTVNCSSAHLAPLSFRAFEDKNFEDLASFAPNYQKSPNVTTSKKKPFQFDPK